MKINLFCDLFVFEIDWKAATAVSVSVLLIKLCELMVAVS